MAYITTEEVKSIRDQLKKEFGKTAKFSVTKQYSSNVSVVLLESEVDFSDKYFQNGKYCEVNYFSIDRHFNSVQAKILNKIKEIILTAPALVSGRDYFDDSDSQTDYFHTAYYYNISVGRYNKEYKQK